MMLDRYRYVAPDEDLDDLLEDVSIGSELSDYNYDEDDEDLLEDSVLEISTPVFHAAPPPPPPLPRKTKVVDTDEAPPPVKKAASKKVAPTKQALPARKAVAAKKAAPAKAKKKR